MLKMPAPQYIMFILIDRVSYRVLNDTKMALSISELIITYTTTQ